MGSAEPENSGEYLQKFKNEDSDFLAGTLSGMMKEETTENLTYLESKAKNIGVAHIFDFFTRYQEFLAGKSFSALERSADFLYSLASKKDGNMYRKFLSMSTLIKIAEDIAVRNKINPDPAGEKLFVKVTEMKKRIVENETDPTLIQEYKGIK